MKFSWKSYSKPTPKKIKKAADALLAGATTLASISFVADYRTIALIVLIVAGLTKVVSNFFEEETVDCQGDSEK